MGDEGARGVRGGEHRVRDADDEGARRGDGTSREELDASLYDGIVGRGGGTGPWRSCFKG